MSVAVTLCLFLICIVTLAAYEFLATKFKKEWHKNITKVIVVTLATTFGSYLWKTVIEIPQREKEENFKRQLIAVVAESSSKTQDMKELLSLKYKEVFRSSEQEARKWVEEFLYSLPEKKRALEAVSEKSNELADRLNIRWDPFYQHVLKQFDDRVQGLAQNDHSISISKSDLKLIFVDNFSSIDETVRRVTFPNNSSIILKVTPAQLERGVLVNTPKITFFISVPGEFQEAALLIALNEKGALIHAANPRYVSLIEDAITDQDPLADEKFRGVVADSMGRLIVFAYFRKHP
ncbi:MAG: hypothetical protein Q8R91_10660 [Candidatus Omnitrophota bacterium]|nr:hypothetical protein [Candidatus Omnitrophota bacterium]